MTTSNFPANTFSLYAGPRNDALLAHIAENRARVQRWARPLTAGLVATALAFTAVALLRDGGATVAASWRDASRPDVIVRVSSTKGSDETANAMPSSRALVGGDEDQTTMASLTGPVPAFLGIGGARSEPAGEAAPEGAAAEAAPAKTPKAEAAPLAAQAAPARATEATSARSPAPTAAKSSAPKPSPQRATSQLSALDKLGGDITSQLK
jgi:hypothetical protein